MLKRSVWPLLLFFFIYALSCATHASAHMDEANLSKDPPPGKQEHLQRLAPSLHYDVEGLHGAEDFGCLVYTSAPAPHSALLQGAPALGMLIPVFYSLFDRLRDPPPESLSASSISVHGPQSRSIRAGTEREPSPNVMRC